VILVLAATVALTIVACSESSETASPVADVELTATFSPADATATWVAFKPERDKITAEILEQQSPRATAIAATQLAMEPPRTPQATGDPLIAPVPTQSPLSQRTIATGPVNRIAFSDGKGSIFTVNPDGTGLATIGKGSSADGEFRYTFPVWSPDGGTVSFSSFFVVGNAVSQSALHRADADGNGVIVTLAIDPTSQSGVGPGVPHFSTWSPKGDRIGLTTSGEFGIGSMLLGSHSGEDSKGIAIGAPLYINWAPDGSAILVHQDEGLHLISVDGSTSGFPQTVGTGSVAYNSPSWSPDSAQFAHVESISGNTSVVITSVNDLDTSEIVGDGDTRVGLGWSPTGQEIAIARSSGTSSHTLSIYDLEIGQERVIHEGETRAFWWSPDGKNLAIIEDSPDVEFAHKWSVIDVKSGELTPLVTQVTSDEFLFVQVFFDQYAESHNIWSPDSSSIVISGALLDIESVLTPGGALKLPDEFDSHIWVIDVDGSDEPVSVGSGTIASWSPQ
jgi:TolB protein